MASKNKVIFTDILNMTNSNCVRLAIIICLIATTICAKAWDKALHVDQETHDLFMKLKDKGALGQMPDERELLARGVYLFRSELSSLYGKLLLRQFTSTDTYKKYSLSYQDLEHLANLFEELEEILVRQYYLELDQLKKCHAILVEQLEHADEQIMRGPFHVSAPQQNRVRQIKQEKDPEPVPEPAIEVPEPADETDSTIDTALTQFYLKKYSEAMTHLEKARFRAMHTEDQKKMDMILFWLIRINILLDEVATAEKYISRFVQNKYSAKIQNFNVKDPERVFLEIEDSLYEHEDSVWLNYWAGSLYLHNSGNQAKSSSFFKKVFTLTQDQK